MTTLKIENRKNTTDKGLEELESLVNSFDFASDIDNIESSSFRCYGDVGDAHNYIWVYDAKWIIKNGNISVEGISAHVDYYEIDAELHINLIKKIDFQGAMAALTEIIEKHNNLCVAKDAEIQTFLDFCKKEKSNKEEI